LGNLIRKFILYCVVPVVAASLRLILKITAWTLDGRLSKADRMEK